MSVRHLLVSLAVQSDALLPGVFGHAGAIQRLTRALARDTLHHALLLSGPRGIGKSRLAAGLAAAGLCDERPHAEPGACGTCSSCRRVAEGLHVDVVRTLGTGKSVSIKRDACDAIIERCQRSPLEGRCHFEILDPGDGLTIEAANALLKTLEEPRPGVFFVLIAENPGRVLPTIRSRVLHVDLAPLGDEELRRVLAEVDGEAAAELSTVQLEMAQGSPGRALDLLRDPALPAAQEFVQLARRAVDEDRSAAIFGGDRSPLWQAWSQLLERTPDPEAEPADASESDAVVVVRKNGRKVRAKAKKKTAKKKSKASSKATPAVQRAAALSICTVWQLGLRQTLRDEAGLSPRGAAATHQLAALQRLEINIQRNPNVRLALEGTLVELCPSLAATGLASR